MLAAVLFVAAAWLALKATAKVLARTDWKSHCWAFGAILLALAAGNGIVSPAAWRDPVAALARNESIQLGSNTPLYPENYFGAKALDLSGFSQSYWGSAPHTPMAAHSFGIDVLVWLLNPPLIDPVSFLRLSQILMFLWCAAGALGFYLFLLIALDLPYAAALAGGVLLLPANPYFASLMTYYFPLFSGAFLTVPWSLLALSAAARRKSGAWAFAAGLLFSLNLYVLPSHPEMELGAAAILAGYAAFLAARARRPTLLVLFLAALGAGACQYALPILAAARTGELSVFGHLDAPRLGLSAGAVAQVCALLLAALWLPKLVERERRSDFAFFFTLAVILAAAVLLFPPPGDGRSFSIPAAQFYAIRSKRLLCWLCFAVLTAGAAACAPAFALLDECSQRARLAALALLLCLCAAGSINYHGAPRADPFRVLPQTLRAAAEALARDDPPSRRLVAKPYRAGEKHPLRDPDYVPSGLAYASRPDFDLPALMARAPSRFLRVIAATPWSSHHVGAVSGGFLLNNAATCVDTRFMEVLGPLQALYLIPGQRYASVGHYDAPSPWNVPLEDLLAPSARRLLNVAGVDAFVFGREQYDLWRDKKDLKELPNDLPKDLEPRLVAVADERSYGIAYLARAIRYVKPLASGAPLQGYVAQAPALEKELASLKRKHDVLIEDGARAGQSQDAGEGALSIENVAGNKAAFLVDCPNGGCVVVFNSAALSGWRAFADEKPLEIRRANYAFLSVAAPRGRHLIWFEHRGPGETAGALATLAAFVAGLAWLALRT